ncbi:MAG: CNNM domain-containing protein, partial [Chloroflexota bacterium]
MFGLGAVFLLVGLNGFFVAAEFALVSVRHTRIDQLVAEGKGSAKGVQKALTHLDDYIAATQLGITLASLALGWVGEPAVA